ncbi:MAG TPA: SLC13 family permease [Balneolales bacterium]|nr:SLC13 family permease [Balneolales bacterium]
MILAVLGTIVSSIYVGHLPHFSANDLKILFILSMLLVIVRGLEHSALFPAIEGRLSQGKWLPLQLIVITAILSMFVTNDAALLVMVPFTLNLSVSHKNWIVIAEAMSANIGSALTPIGNPQNLYIYSHYHVHVLQFMAEILPFVAVGLFGLVVWGWSLNSGFKNATKARKVFLDRNSYVFGFFLLLIMLVVLHILPFYLSALVLIYVLLVDRRLLKIDYSLLLTFFLFFGFSNNLVSLIDFRFVRPGRIFWFSALSSQVISNVPTALLFAKFTGNWRDLLWGVSVGGLGNLVGSLANLIAYRFYSQRTGKVTSFLWQFHVVGYLAFGISCLIYYLV